MKYKSKPSPLEIGKQNPSTLKPMRNAIIHIRAAAKTGDKVTGHLRELSSSIKARFGLSVTVKATTKKTYISADYLAAMSGSLKINLFALGKRDRTAVKQTKKALAVTSKITGKVNYSSAKITGSATKAKYTLWLNIDSIANQSIPGATSTILRNVGFAFHMTASVVTTQTARGIMIGILKDGYKKSNFKNDLVKLKTLGVIVSIQDKTLLNRLMATGQKDKVCATINKRIKTNVLDRMPKGTGFVSQFGGGKALAKALEDGEISLEDDGTGVLITIFGIFVILMSIDVLIFGLILTLTGIFAIPGIFLMYLGVIMFKGGIRMINGGVKVDRRDNVSKVIRDTGNYIKTMRRNKVISTAMAVYKKRFRSSREALISIESDDVTLSNEELSEFMYDYDNAMLDYCRY